MTTALQKESKNDDNTKKGNAGQNPSGNEEQTRQTAGDDYWDRIAEDPASGYKKNGLRKNTGAKEDLPGKTV